MIRCFPSSEEYILGDLPTLERESSAQDNTQRINYKLIGNIDDSNVLKGIINEMQHISRRFEDKVLKSYDSHPDEYVGNDYKMFSTNAEYCIWEQKVGNLLVCFIALPVLGEEKKRVGFAAYIVELELVDKSVQVKANRLYELESIEGVALINPYSTLTRDSSVSSFLEDSGIVLDKLKADVDTPFEIMLQVHKYITNGSSDAFNALQESCEDLTEIKKHSLLYSLQHEIEVIALNEDIQQKELLTQYLIEIFSIIPDLIADIYAKVMLKANEIKKYRTRDRDAMTPEESLLQNCYNGFRKKNIDYLGEVDELEGKYQQYIVLEKHNQDIAAEKKHLKYSMTYLYLRLMPALSLLIAALKMHILQYFIVHIPLFLVFAAGITITHGYVVTVAVIVSLSAILSCYSCLKYVVERICLKFYSNENYAGYSEFCKQASFKKILYDLGCNLKKIIVDVSIRLNTFIMTTIDSISKQIKSYYSSAADQVIPEIIKLKELIFKYSIMRIVQNLMLVGALLCLLLPAYNLICAITMLVGYVAFSCYLVIPKRSEIISATGSSVKATEVSTLFACSTPGVESYNRVAKFLGYSSSPKQVSSLNNLL